METPEGPKGPPKLRLVSHQIRSCGRHFAHSSADALTHPRRQQTHRERGRAAHRRNLAYSLRLSK